MQSLYVALLAIALSTALQSLSSFNRHILVGRVLAALVLAAPIVIGYLWIGDSYDDIGIFMKCDPINILIIFLLSSMALLVNYLFAGRLENRKRYPQLRSNEWTLITWIVNSTTWIIYLVAYESLFRGYFFFNCLNYFSLNISCLLNIIVYAAAHLHKNLNEVILSIFFGFLLCLVTWHTQSFWGAVAIHVSLALSNDYFAWRANPQMKFIGKPLIK